jgi:hypothetical protein
VPLVACDVHAVRITPPLPSGAAVDFTPFLVNAAAVLGINSSALSCTPTAAGCDLVACERNSAVPDNALATSALRVTITVAGKPSVVDFASARLAQRGETLDEQDSVSTARQRVVIVAAVGGALGGVMLLVIIGCIVKRRRANRGYDLLPSS